MQCKDCLKTPSTPMSFQDDDDGDARAVFYFSVFFLLLLLFSSHFFSPPPFVLHVVSSLFLFFNLWSSSCSVFYYPAKTGDAFLRLHTPKTMKPRIFQRVSTFSSDGFDCFRSWISPLPKDTPCPFALRPSKPRARFCSKCRVWKQEQTQKQI